MFGLRGLAAKIFGTTNDRKVTKYKPRVDEINALEPALAALSDAELRARTQTSAQIPVAEPLIGVETASHQRLQGAASDILGAESAPVIVAPS